MPATLTPRTRLLRTGHGRKTEGIDALSVAEISATRPQLRRIVGDDHTTLLRPLTDTFGISDLLAAKIISHTGPVSEFATADACANDTGTAPIEMSSDGKGRHRLSRTGNRQLNSAIHFAAHVQRAATAPLTAGS